MLKLPSHIVKYAKSNDLLVSVRIGKEGVTDSLIKELDTQLKSKNIVKLKANRQILGSSEERKNVFSEIANSTNSFLVFHRGNVAVYWRTN
ncbi:MAG: ribosome assembly protein YhbY [Euryarchaeota archaeon]|nr:ribosome assembly protein YhbY [Euryarchaeota archaeon]|tara:strand:- start:328 stop:600 length:273 start_codon:yes stop_codon:yes gene_type:complete